MKMRSDAHANIHIEVNRHVVATLFRTRQERWIKFQQWHAWNNCITSGIK